MAREDPCKKGRNTSWIRYGRHCRLSAGAHGLVRAPRGQMGLRVSWAMPARRSFLAVSMNTEVPDAAVELLHRVLVEYGHIRRLRGGVHGPWQRVLPEQEERGWQSQASFRGVLQGEGPNISCAGIIIHLSNGELEKWFGCAKTTGPPSRLLRSSRSGITR